MGLENIREVLGAGDEWVSRNVEEGTSRRRLVLYVPKGLCIPRKLGMVIVDMSSAVRLLPSADYAQTGLAICQLLERNILNRLMDGYFIEGIPGTIVIAVDRPDMSTLARRYLHQKRYPKVKPGAEYNKQKYAVHTNGRKYPKDSLPITTEQAKALGFGPCPPIKNIVSSGLGRVVLAALFMQYLHRKAKMDSAINPYKRTHMIFMTPKIDGATPFATGEVCCSGMCNGFCKDIPSTYGEVDMMIPGILNAAYAANVISNRRHALVHANKDGDNAVVITSLREEVADCVFWHRGRQKMILVGSIEARELQFRYPTPEERKNKKTRYTEAEELVDMWWLRRYLGRTSNSDPTYCADSFLSRASLLFMMGSDYVEKPACVAKNALLRAFISGKCGPFAMEADSADGSPVVAIKRGAFLDTIRYATTFGVRVKPPIKQDEFLDLSAKILYALSYYTGQDATTNGPECQRYGWHSIDEAGGASVVVYNASLSSIGEEWADLTTTGTPEGDALLLFS